VNIPIRIFLPEFWSNANEKLSLPEKFD